MLTKSFSRLYLFTLLALATPLFASPTSTLNPGTFANTIVQEALDIIPDGFASSGPVPGTTPITLTIGLASNDIKGLEKQLYAVSTPNGAQYRQFLSQAEVDQFVSPSSDDVSSFLSWLDIFGVKNDATSSSPSGAWYTLTLPAAVANKLFGTTFTYFTNTATGVQTIQALSYSVPVILKDVIQVVEPTTSFPNAGPIGPIVSVAGGKLSKRQTDCASKVTPACLQSLYGIPATPATQTNNQLVVPGFVNEYAQQADLTTFLKNFRTDFTNGTFAVQLIDGGVNPQDPSKAGVEANLDIQYTVGLATNVPVTFFSSGMSSIQGFINMMNSLLSQQIAPTVVSISYGFNENVVSQSSANALCNIFMQLGTKGTSILVASGDGGVAGSRPNSTCTKFVPTFPASCPYITAVGATKGNPDETAADLSAGGFSNYFEQPGYQGAAVANYLTTLGSSYVGRYNPTGRGFPDVSAQGESIAIVNGGQGVLVDGTSASAPIFASVIALINDQLLAAGKQTLGFLNPWLYDNPNAFKDITAGSNPSCNTNGFSAQAGWDAVTGLGTPIFSKMASAAGL